MQDFNNDLIRRTDALNMVHNFFLAKIKAVSGDREEIPMGELDPFLKDNKELAAKIKSIPNFEAVPVVRCKDCKFFHTYADGSEVGLCYVWATDCEEPECNKYDFCSYGERKAV